MTPAAYVAEPANGTNLRYRALIRLAEAIRSQPDPSDLFEALALQLHEFVPFDVMARFDRAANKVQWHLPHGYRSLSDHYQSVPKESTIPWWVHQNQQPVILQVEKGDSRFPRLTVMAELGLRSLCALPLSTAHQQLGSLVFVSRVEDAYSEEEQRFLSLVADQIALALEGARSQERLRLLLEITNRVVSKLDLRELLQEVVSGVRQVMRSDAVGVVLPDPETGQLRLYALDFPGHEKLPEGEPVLRCMEQTYRAGQRINLTKEEIAAEPRFSKAGHNSVCMLPLASRGRVLGVFGVASHKEAAFADDDLSFLGQVADQIALAVENAVTYHELSQLKEKLARENVYLESEIRNELGFEEIVGKSEALRRVLAEIETVAPTDSTVLIYGETGTGKELIARALHNLSSRKSHAFVKLNCAAIPTGLLESELFGHEKGAFTGAIAQRIGRFELAHRGTIFLDEIGDVPLELQPKLLRVLQEREFERLGSTRTLRSDARLIAATNRDLKAMADEQKFRPDLYYRLNVFPIRVPSLRDRAEDIPLLVRHFVQQFSQRNNRLIETVPSETMEALMRYPWPGNIRELQNVIERAVIVSKGLVLNVPVADLKSDLKSDAKAGPPAARNGNLQEMLDETERAAILGALEDSHWVVAGPNGAAALLGMKRTTLQVRMEKLGIRLSRSAVQEAKR
jgi:formate hydrogenlyase transcriptional activator